MIHLFIYGLDRRPPLSPPPPPMPCSLAGLLACAKYLPGTRRWYWWRYCRSVRKCKDGLGIKIYYGMDLTFPDSGIYSFFGPLPFWHLVVAVISFFRDFVLSSPSLPCSPSYAVFCYFFVVFPARLCLSQVCAGGGLPWRDRRLQ